LIFVGVRQDVGADPAFPVPLPYVYTVRDAMPWIFEQGDNAGYGGGAMRSADRPSPTIGAAPFSGNGRFPPSRIRTRYVHDTSGRFSLGERTDSPSPAILTYPHHFQIHGPTPVTHDPETGDSLAFHSKIFDEDGRKLTLGELRVICGFPADFELTGPYHQRWERLGRAVPPVMMSHIAGVVRDQVLAPSREVV
jgi:DNA (cytosine-5)-methyltransferase 1